MDDSATRALVAVAIALPFIIMLLALIFLGDKANRRKIARDIESKGGTVIRIEPTSILEYGRSSGSTYEVAYKTHEGKTLSARCKVCWSGIFWRDPEILHPQGAGDIIHCKWGSQGPIDDARFNGLLREKQLKIMAIIAAGLACVVMAIFAAAYLARNALCQGKPKMEVVVKEVEIASQDKDADIKEDYGKLKSKVRELLPSDPGLAKKSILEREAALKGFLAKYHDRPDDPRVEKADKSLKNLQTLEAMYPQK